jgi:hypothetical protein
MRTHDAPDGRWLAVFPVLAVGLLMLAGALIPKGLDRPITGVSAALEQLSIAAANPGRVYGAYALVVLGLGALAVAFVAIATLARQRGSAVAAWATTIGVFGCLCGTVTNVLVGIDLAGAASAHVTRASAAAVLVSTNTASISTAFLVAYVSGVLIAGVLTGVALWRSRAVPRWVAIAFPVALALGATAPSGIVNVLSLPMAIVMVLLAARIWRAAVVGDLAVSGPNKGGTPPTVPSVR